MRNLALALSRFPGPGPLVVGIQGPWGSGKTSLKNMLVEQLAAANFDKKKGKNQEDRAIVVEFEPWMYSGSGRLVSLLFRQISQTLSRKSDVVKHVATKFAKSAAKVAPLIPSTAPVSGAAIAKSFSSFAESLEPSSEDSELLSKRRRKLEEKLKKSATRIVVFIDDLDRLMDDEVTDVMRAVKAVGDLPYMTYVLLYDRDSLTKSLDKSCHDKGDEYLEKIVQVPIGLPEPIKETVLSRLRDELTSVVGEQNINRIYIKSSDDLFSPAPDIYKSCVVPFINNMRNVNRLTNEFMLRYQVLKDDVELKDLLGITSLEVFN
ncbi:MAG: KAP family NTPase, partial [Bifidobacteriales bacterium]|nr:KAP family NTPase [Bifidobacteriales bacterium]